MILATIILLIAQGPNGGVTPQQQIDLAPPGAVLRIAARGESITIRKPLTLLGEGDFAPGSLQDITLDGPGTGDVSLVGFSVQGGIKGGGFSEVRLERILHAPDGVNVEGVHYLELAWCHLYAVRATSSTVVSSGTTWLGQAAPQMEAAEFYGYGAQPFVVNAPVYRAGVQDVYVSQPVRWGNSFDVAWRTPGPYGFLYVSMSGSRSPEPMPGANFGRNHLGTWPGVELLAIDRCSPDLNLPAGRYTFDLPPDRSLMGRQLAFQVYDPPGYYSAPAFVTIR